MKNTLIVSDLDGVIRDLYSPLYEVYIKIYEKNIGIDQFIKSIIHNITEENSQIFWNLINTIGRDIYNNAKGNKKIIEMYKRLIDKYNAELIICTVYVDEDIEKRTLYWISHNVDIRAPVYMYPLGNKRIPQQYSNISKVIIIEDDIRSCYKMASSTNKVLVQPIIYDMVLDDENRIIEIEEICNDFIKKRGKS